jgi:hypothetical protein
VVVCEKRRQKEESVMTEQPMDTTTRRALWRQFGATIDMLENAQWGTQAKADEGDE